MMIRLATYNVHKLTGSDGKWNETRIAEVIGAINADVFAIQEFVSRPGAEISATADDFAAALGYHVIAQPLLRPNGMEQFNLLLSRLAAQDPKLIELPRDGREPRGAIRTDFSFGGRQLRVISTHLGLTPASRYKQLSVLLEDHPRHMPFVLMGDLNLMLPREPAQRHTRALFRGQRQPATFPSRWPLLALDSILVSPPELIRSIYRFDRSPARRASDHLPLVAEIAMG